LPSAAAHGERHRAAGVARRMLDAFRVGLVWAVARTGTAQGGWWGAWVARGVPWSAGSGLPLGNGGGGGRASPGAVTPLRRDRCWCEFGGLVVDLRSGARRERHRAAGGGRGSLGACRGRPGLDCRSGTAAAVAARARGPWRRCDETGAGASSEVSWSTCAAAHGGTAQGGWRGAWVARCVPWSAGSGLPLGNGGGGGRASPGAVAPLRRDRCWCEFGGLVVDLRSGARRNGTGRLAGGVGRSVRAVVGQSWTAARTATAQGGGWRGSPDARCVPWSAWSGLPLERLASAVAPHRGPWRRCPERGLVAGFEE
jgi:hypothetical protein